MPRLLTICGTLWEVYEINPTTVPDPKWRDCWGFIDYEKQAIYVHPDASPYTYQQTLQYEVLRAIEFINGFELGFQTRNTIAAALTTMELN